MVSANQSFSKIYTYTLPATWNANNMTVVAFINKKIGATPIISQGTEVLNAEEAFIGFPTATLDVADNQFSVGECYPNPR